MTHVVQFASRAERNLDAIFAYIEAQSGTDRADSFVSEIVAHCLELETFPERGTRRDDLLPGLRTTGFRRRVTVAFRVEPASVTILGIFYAGQDFETLLSYTV